MQIWIIQILGIVVHFILMISVYDVQRRSESFQGYWKNCTNQAIAKRLVLIIFGGLDTKLLDHRSIQSSLLDDIKKSGVWGRAVTSSAVKTNTITAVTSGFEEPQELFSNIYKKERREPDHIFNYASKILYIGDNETVKNQFKLASKSWTKTILKSNYNITRKKQTFFDVVKTTYDIDKSVKDLNRVIIFIHLPENIVKWTKKLPETEEVVPTLMNVIGNLTLATNSVFQDLKTIYILCSDKVEGTRGTNRSDPLFLMWGKNIKQSSNLTINATDISLIASTILGNPSPLSSVSSWKNGLMNMTSTEEVKGKACNALHLATVAGAVLQQVGNKVLKNIGLSHSSSEETIKELEKQLSISLTVGNNTKETSYISDTLTNVSLSIIKKDTIFIQGIINSLMHMTYVGWSLFLLTKIISLSIKRDAELKHELKILRRKTELWFFGLHTVLILLGGLCILFVIIQSWPIYYIMYCIPALIIWGSIINNVQNWIGFVNKLNKFKLMIALGYVLAYGLIVELYFWGLSCSTLLVLLATGIAGLNVITCYINNEYIGIKMTTIISGLFLVGSIYIPLDNKTEAVPILISSGLVWPITGILSIFYMWISNEIVDAIVMIACLTHYCTSLIIIIISAYQEKPMSPIIFIILFASAYYIPIFGKTFLPAAVTPLSIDRYRKSNRLQHVCFCTSSLILLFSVSFETFFTFVLYVFAMLWLLITEPKLQIESLNKKNGHYAIIFTVLVIIIQHVLALNEPAQEILYTMKHFLPAGDLIVATLEQIKIYLPVFIIQFIFTSLTKSSGGESQLLLAMLIQNLCGYRLFLGMEGFHKLENSDKYVLAHTSLQALMMFQFMTRQVVQSLLHASFLKTSDYMRSVIEGIRDMMNR